MMEGSDVRLMDAFAFDVGPTSTQLLYCVKKITLNGISLKIKTIPNVFVTLAVKQNRISLSRNRIVSNAMIQESSMKVWFFVGMSAGLCIKSRCRKSVQNHVQLEA